MRFKAVVAGSLLMTLAMLMVRCTNNNVAGNSSEIGNATGKLAKTNGTPAVGVTVRFVRADHNPRQGLSKILATVDSATTDANGAYTVTLDSGTYNMLAKGDTTLAYLDSIKTIKDSTVTVPTDTLKAPGSISGAIRLQGADDARTVFILFMGTNTWATPDDSTGKFTVAGLAEGTYKVRILTTLDAYLPKDTVLSVTAGKVDSLTHDIVLQYTGIPIPAGLKISYDTLKQIVALSWNKPTTGRTVSGYNIYRQYMGSTDSSLVKIKSSLTDTVFHDSTGIQDQTYEYRAAAVDSNGTEGTKSAGISVDVTSAFSFGRVFAPKGSVDGQVLEPLGLATDRNGNIYVVDGGNFRVQRFDTSGHMLLKFGSYGSADSQFNSPYDLTVDSSGNIYITDNGAMKVKKFDSSGAFIKAWLTKGYPAGIAILGTNKLCVTSGGFGYIFTLNGDSLGVWPISSEVKGIATLGDSIIFVSCTDSVIRRFNAAGVLQTSWPVQGASQGFNFTLTNSGEIFAAMGYKVNYVFVIDTNGTIISRFGNSGTGIGSLNYPKDVVVVNKSIFVSDNNGIQLFTRP